MKNWNIFFLGDEPMNVGSTKKSCIKHADKFIQAFTGKSGPKQNNPIPLLLFCFWIPS